MAAKPAVVIASAGSPVRAPGLGPKAALKVGREPLLAAQVRACRSAWPGCRVTVVIGHEAERVLAVLPSRCHFALEPDHAEHGPLFSLALGLRAAGGGPAVLLLGDAVYSARALAGLADAGDAALVDSSGRLPSSDVGVTVADGQAQYFSYGQRPKWGRACYLGRGACRAFLAFAGRGGAERLLAHEALNHLALAGLELRAHRPGGTVALDISTPRDLRRASVQVNRLLG
jgi:CTP:molybdopterin cytidylyltransferase MocA